MLNDELYYQNTKLTPRSEFEEIKFYIDEFLDGNNINRFITLKFIIVYLLLSFCSVPSFTLFILFRN